MLSRRYSSLIAALGLLGSAAVGCGDTKSLPAGDLDATNDSPARCGDQRQALVNALQSNQSCVVDGDCVQYNALCLQAESGNCAGIFYVNTSAVSQLKAREADLDSCTGSNCGAGGSCGLGGLPPACHSGVCAGQGS